MAAIGAADLFGLPVSTTQVVSSGIAGAMAANRSGLQWGHHQEYGLGMGVDTAGFYRALGRSVLAVSPDFGIIALLCGARGRGSNTTQADFDQYLPGYGLCLAVCVSAA